MDLTQPVFRNESKERKSLDNSLKKTKIINMQYFILLEGLQFYHACLRGSPSQALQSAAKVGYLNHRQV